MIRVVVHRQQQGAQIRLPVLAGGDRRHQIVDLPRDARHPANRPPVSGDARHPRGVVLRCGLVRPVVVRPGKVVLVSRVDAEVEDVLQRDLEVLHQLPR